MMFIHSKNIIFTSVALILNLPFLFTFPTRENRFRRSTWSINTKDIIDLDLLNNTSENINYNNYSTNLDKNKIDLNFLNNNSTFLSTTRLENNITNNNITEIYQSADLINIRHEEFQNNSSSSSISINDKSNDEKVTENSDKVTENPEKLTGNNEKLTENEGETTENSQSSNNHRSARLRTLEDREERNREVSKENAAISFMQKFGYIPESDGTGNFAITETYFKKQIQKVQKFGALPQTGELDEITLQLMNSPRCGVPDVIADDEEESTGEGLTSTKLKGRVAVREEEEEKEGRRRPKRFIVGGGGWNKRNITYHLENYSSKLDGFATVEKELRRAFDSWSSYARLNFTSVPERDADIIIYFAAYDHFDGYPFDGQGGTLAHAYYPYEFGHYGGDIHFDESEQWAINPTDDYSGLDFFTVAVHEIGHSLGLSHSPVSTSIMFPYYQGSAQQNFHLDYDDILGMYQLYIQRHLPGDEEYFRQHHSDTNSNISTTTTTTTKPTIETITTSTTERTIDDTQNDDAGVEGADVDTSQSGTGKTTTDDNEPEIDVINDDDKSKTGDFQPRCTESNDNNKSDGEKTDYECVDKDANQTNASETNNNNNNTDTILYYGDSISVEEYHRKLYGDNYIPNNIPVIPTENEEEIIRKREEEERRKYEEERRKEQDEADRRRQEEIERHQEEERRWYEEIEKRRQEEERKRAEERKRVEDEIRRKEEEVRRRYEEELLKREQERKEHEDRRKLEEDRLRKEDEERIRAYEEEIRKYEETLRKLHENITTTTTDNPDLGFSPDDEPFFDSGNVVVSSSAPDICNGRIDAVANIRDELFMFKGQFMWRFRSRGVLRSGYPAPIRALFSSLPSWIDKIDAVYQRKNDSVIIFFVGKEFYEHRSRELEQSKGRPLTDLGLPETVLKLDAAFYWPKNGKVYFFRHDSYWRFDEATGRMEENYPQPMDRWHGMPAFIDAAYTWQAAVSYFFKEDEFWEFDNYNIQAVDGYPKKTKEFWFKHCRN